jgi:site-specific DNA recombinase
MLRDGSPGVATAAIYARISADSEKLGLGVARQESECRKLCAERGFTVVEVFRDNDLSASTGKARPQYKEMLRRVVAGEIRWIVALRSDRLYRYMPDLVDFVRTVQAANADVALVMASDLRLDTADGRTQAYILGAIAAGETEKSGERIRSKEKENAIAGRAHGGVRAWGYNQSQGIRTTNEHEAEVIRDVVRRLLGGQTLRSVAVMLNAAGERTTGGHNFKASVVKRAVLCKYMIGIREHKPKGATRATESKAQWQGIISAADQAMLRAKLNRKGVSENVRPWKRGNFLLSGLLKCSVCGATLIHRKTTQYGYLRYQCPAPPHGKNCVGILQSSVDEFVFNTVKARLDTVAFPVPPEAHVDTSRLDALRAARQENLADVLLKPDDRRAILDNIDAAIEAERATIDDKVANSDDAMVLAEARAHLSRMTEGDFMSMDDVEYTRNLIGAVTSRIEILRTTRRGGTGAGPASERVVITFIPELA